MVEGTGYAAGHEDVAIVGVGMRFPGDIRCLDDLWAALIDERDLVGEIPADRFDANAVFDPRPRAGRSCTRSGAFLPAIDQFDAGYFDISPREATRLDPQQRLLLECTVEALDDAGIDPAGLAGTETGVVIGVSFQDYGVLQGRRSTEANAYSMIGTAMGNTANRISYTLDARGPSFAVDTACSSSLTALHEAVELVRSGRSPVALAGAVNILLDPFKFVGFSSASMLSPTGRCHPFSSRADGYVRAEGAGIVVLKRLSDAAAAGDRIHAVVRATGINSDGRTVGLSLPSLGAQIALLRRIYHTAGISPHEVSYVEAHGTGTPAGDPIECAALGEVLGKRRGQPLPIGSVKSNLGHAESAAGLAGVFKAILVLREAQIPASLHTEPLNETIDFAGLNLEPVSKARPLVSVGRNLVGVNSFGFGGANAHAVLASPPQDEAEVHGPGRGMLKALPLVLSARSRTALKEAAGRWSGFLAAVDAGRFDDVCYTACRRRGHHRERYVVIAAGPAEAAAKLDSVAQGHQITGVAEGSAASLGRIGFVFNGNGSQWPAMGAELFAADRAFRREVEEWNEVLAPMLGWPVARSLVEPDQSKVTKTEFAQPLLFVMQCGIAAALNARGMRATVVVGHSVGEVAAAYHCGALDRRTAGELIVARSKAQGRTVGRGRMAAVRLAEDEVRALLAQWGFAQRLVVAAINGPDDVTLAGDAAALREIGAKLDHAGIGFRDVGLDYPFHSPAMDPVKQQILGALAHVKPVEGDITFVSTVTGGSVPGTELDASYWWRNLREPVRFAPAITSLTKAEGCDVLIEVGPHPVLNGYLRRCAAESEAAVAVIATVSRGASGAEALDTTLAHTLAAGGVIDWDALMPRPGRVVSLPAYPWQRERHWTGGPHWWDGDGDQTDPTVPAHPLLGRRRTSPLPEWINKIGPVSHGWLADHRVGQAVVMPAAAYVDMALCAGEAIHCAPSEVLRMVIDRALVLPFDEPESDVHVSTTVTDDGRFRIASQAARQSDWDEHASGRVRRLAEEPPDPLAPEAELAECPKRMEATEHYARCAAAGLHYGPQFHPLKEIGLGDGKAVARYAVDGTAAAAAVVDAAAQLAIAEGESPAGWAYLPTRFEKVRRWREACPEGWVVVNVVSRTVAEVVIDAWLTDSTGGAWLEIDGCHLRRVPTESAGPVATLSEVLRVAAPIVLPRSAALPAPQDSFDAIGGRMGVLRERLVASEHFEVRQGLLQLAAHFTVDAVARMCPARGPFQLEDLTAAGMMPKFVPLMRMLLRLAARHGLLVCDSGGGGWRISEPGQPEQIFRSLADAYPGHGVDLHLFGVAGRNLHSVLLGRTDPVELLLSGADSLVAQAYDHEQLMHLLNGVCRELVHHMVTRCPDGRPIRILEVGAGTGATTATVLPGLPSHRVHYTYTDVSSGHFRRAAQRFEAFDFVEFRTLNLEESPEAQGFQPGAYDLVIAANALHATRDLRATLRHVAELLAGHGQLLAIEPHDEFYVGPVFGLLDSYWRASDTSLRPEGPVLSRSAWRTLLEECGFTPPIQTEPFDSRTEGVSAMLSARGPRTEKELPLNTPSGTVYIAVIGAEGESPLIKNLRRCGQSVAPIAEPAHAWNDGSHIVLLVPECHYADAAEETRAAVKAIAALRAIASAAPPGDEADLPKVWIACGTTAVIGSHPVALPVPAAAVWGAARALAAEDHRFDIRRIALVGMENAPADIARGLLAEMSAGGTEDEVTLTAEGRFVTRVRPVPVPTASGEAPSFALSLQDAGPRYALRWQPAPIPEPQPDEVIVRVEAAALNYRDVLTATDMLRHGAQGGADERTDLGLECAGTVTAVGIAVTEHRVGDRVCGMTAGAFAGHAPLRSTLAFSIPDGMTCSDAATIPVAFTTVHECLAERVKLQPGETVLVHGGAGGVGLAVVQYCRHLGVRVIATAGTPAKRDLLHLLGVADVLDSRTAGFAGQVWELTGGEGVDVVVNSLAGDGLVRSLEVLKPHGRFVELGKRDFLADSSLPAALFMNNITFTSADVMDRLHRKTGTANGHYLRRVATGVYRPLPLRTFPAARIGEAFELMRHSRHIGKIVITFDDPVPLTSAARPLSLDPSATYLITGGLEGFGAATARHLAERGARHLTLIGRRGDSTPESAELCQSLRRSGVDTAVFAADVADGQALRRVFDELARTGRPVRGVVHAAMHLDDAMLPELDDGRLAAALSAKVEGCRNLDVLTRGMQLDLFIGYSSVLALIGNQRQAGYVAANLAVEAMMRARRDDGLPALAVQWGVVGDVGVAFQRNMIRELESAGVPPIPAREALSYLDGLLSGSPPVITISRIDWHAAHRMSGTVERPRLSAMLPSPVLASGLPAAAVHNAPPAKANVEALLCGLVAQVLLSDVERMDSTRSLGNLGVDSLMGAELSTLIRQQLGCHIPVVELLGFGSVKSIAERVVARTSHRPFAAGSRAPRVA